MKAISVKQPWANLIARGEKTIETRTWHTPYRGKILIVSSKTPKIEPAGCALAVCYLAACRAMTKDDEDYACCAVYPGAFSWMLSRAVRIVPIPVRGQLGIYDVDLTDDDLKPWGSQSNTLVLEG